MARKSPAGQVRERWLDLWPFFASSLHQTGAAMRTRISATPAQTRNVRSGIQLPSAPRNPRAWTARPLGSARNQKQACAEWLRRALRAGDPWVVGGCHRRQNRGLVFTYAHNP